MADSLPQLKLPLLKTPQADLLLLQVDALVLLDILLRAIGWELPPLLLIQ